MTTADMDDADFGPAMRSLTPRMRGFVQAMVANPGCNRSMAAQAAGYTGSSKVALRVAVHRLMHDQRILAAMDELTTQRLQSTTLVAAAALERIILSKRTDDKVKLKAIAMVMDRTGHSATQTINVNKTVTDRTGPGMLERIRQLAAANGLDPVKLLGGNSAPVVDGEFSEVSNGE